MERLERLLRVHDASALAVVDVDGGGAFTWGDWVRASDRLTASLQTAGVAAGDRVALLLPRSPRYLAALTACWEVGAVAVPLDPSSTPSEVAAYLEHAEASAAIVDEARPDDVALVTADGLVVRRAGHPRTPSETSDALILYTSGSTGPPKGARLTHAAVLASIRALCAHYGLSREARVLGTLPLFTSHGLFVHGLSTLAHGGTLVLGPLVGAFTARGLFERVKPYAPTFFTSVPACLSLLASASGGDPPPGMRVGSASSPLSETVRDAWQARFDRVVMNSFGMSEACGWFIYGDESQPAGSIGRPGPCELRIEGPDADGRGELLVRGAQVTAGYWRSQADPFLDGWFRTGDLARIDSDGWVYCVGRAKRVIHRAGRSIHPEDVEAVLMTIEGVREAVVVGAPHAILGEAPRAFVIARPGCALRGHDLFAVLRDRLSAFRVPLWVEVVDDVPRTRNGKPDLRALAALPPPTSSGA